MPKDNTLNYRYEQLLDMIADELNIQEIELASGGSEKGDWRVYFAYDTLTHTGEGLKFELDGKIVDAPRSCLAVARAHFGAKED